MRPSSTHRSRRRFRNSSRTRLRPRRARTAIAVRARDSDTARAGGRPGGAAHSAAPRPDGRRKVPQGPHRRCPHQEHSAEAGPRSWLHRDRPRDRLSLRRGRPRLKRRLAELPEAPIARERAAPLPALGATRTHALADREVRSRRAASDWACYPQPHKKAHAHLVGECWGNPTAQLARRDDPRVWLWNRSPWAVSGSLR